MCVCVCVYVVCMHVHVCSHVCVLVCVYSVFDSNYTLFLYGHMCETDLHCSFPDLGIGLF